ncbi:TasA family protein [Sutcliffiella halmapala]|uniref:TasA family protein n=1 Tax=Sutcliffiella halmapala TaxID=79882 RepID=UPI000995347A|nr:TasA family protein [Sutcliffiella halmapala]
MRYNKLFLSITIVTLVFYSVFFVSLNSAVASTETTKEIDIMTTPESILFDVTNMKPGDWAERTLVITNKGKKDISYLTSAKLTSGSKKLYNELSLSISDKDGEIFNGKLAGFNKLAPREIKTSAQEELIFTVTFPPELGNDFQGLASEVEFKFYAEGTLGGLIPAENGIKLPNTATDTLNFIIIGGILLMIGIIVVFIFRKKRAGID